MNGVKQILLLLVFFFAHFYSKAQNDTLWLQANTLYTQEQFAEAIDVYKQIENNGVHNAKLYYNMGNTFFKQNEIPKSILYYERALRLAPHDEDIQYNLSLSNTHIVDKIEPLPVFFAVSWIIAFRKMMPIDVWAVIGIILFGFALIVCLITFFSSIFTHRKLVLLLAIVMLFASFFCTSIAYYENKEFSNRSNAIVFSPVTAVKAAPNNGSIDLFILHEGTKVHIMETISEWKKIRTADGNQGWIMAESLEVI
ncbi:MAG: tetratricopeptide repeat protein [Bacteroidales bacterium]